MKSPTRTMTYAAAVALALGFGTVVSAQAEDPSGYGDGYQSGAYGRVRSADGGATIIRADAERGEPDAAGVNAPLFPGDTVRTDGSQRVEIQLAGGTIVRIDRGGEVIFQSLPNPSAKYHDNTVLALNAGTLRIASRLGEKDEFRIDTRAASVYLLGEGEYRIGSDDRGATVIASLRGVAEVVGNDASVLVRGGMKTAAVAGATPETPHAYTAFSSDGFDRWCEARNDVYRVQDRHSDVSEQPADVPEEVRPYQTELATNGHWTVDTTYGSVWYPAGVSAGWRPYSNGYWSYGPGGWFWVSYEPWGWAPYHYGNWQWTGALGWGWVPGPVFAGAWVSWSWGAAYVGWAPLDYWGRPGWIGGPYYGGYYDPGCWTFVNYNNINERHLPRYAVPIDRVRDDLRNATVVSRAPSVDPRRIADSQAWRDRARREVADDRSAHMSPGRTDRVPVRTLTEVQDQLMRRPAPSTPIARSPGNSPVAGTPRNAPLAGTSRNASGAPSTDRRTITPRSRRILDDPRADAPASFRPETRDDVRELYQRMSRPRETRGQESVVPRGTSPSYRMQQSRVEAPRTLPPQASTPRAQAPRTQEPQVQAPRVQSPKTQAPPAQAPKAEAPRNQTPRSQAAPKPKTKRGGRE
jgi:hypothetical protein